MSSETHNWTLHLSKKVSNFPYLGSESDGLVLEDIGMQYAFGISIGAMA
ncbi:MAG: hypothetical protein HWQ37_14665 [Nostoc sp. NMS4]|nr:hypothetical protein [Nostoc sp. NMS4]